MPYYQTLKERRQGLGLTIQDVCSQTRLKPEYIRAIEEHNLDLFSDDFSYVRYFVHAYADAIGVNWEMIRDEVDQDVSVFAQVRDQALYQAQVKMIETMPSVKADAKRSKARRRKSKKTFLENSAGAISRRLSWGSSPKLRRNAVIGAVVVFIALCAFSYIRSASAKRALDENRQAREQELNQREQETQRLADELQSRKDSSATPAQSTPQLSVMGLEQENTFQVSGFTQDNPVIHLSFYAIGGQTVTITWNGVPAFSEAVSGTGNYDLQAGQSGTLSVVFSSPSVYNALSVEGTEIPANFTLNSPEGGCRIILNIVYGQKGQSDSSQSASEQNQVQNDTEDYTAPIGNETEMVDDYTAPLTQDETVPVE